MEMSFISSVTGSLCVNKRCQEWGIVISINVKKTEITSTLSNEGT